MVDYITLLNFIHCDAVKYSRSLNGGASHCAFGLRFTHSETAPPRTPFFPPPSHSHTLALVKSCYFPNSNSRGKLVLSAAVARCCLPQIWSTHVPFINYSPNHPTGHPTSSPSYPAVWPMMLVCVCVYVRVSARRAQSA